MVAAYAKPMLRLCLVVVPVGGRSILAREEKSMAVWLRKASILSYALLGLPCATVGGGVTNAQTASTPCTSINAYGADPTGASNSDVALSTAISAQGGPSKAVCVSFGPGNYSFSSQFTHSFSSGGSLSLIGSGVEVTKLTWASAGGIKVNFPGGTTANGLSIGNMSIYTGSAGSGYGIDLESVTFPASIAGYVPVSLRNLYITGTGSSNYWARGINVVVVSNIDFDNVSIAGHKTEVYATVGEGVHLSGISSPPNNIPGVVYNFRGSNLSLVNRELVYDTQIQGVTITNSNFTGNTTDIYVPSGATNLDELSISNSQFSFNSIGIDLESQLNNTSIGNNLISPACGAACIGIKIANSGLALAITGNTITGGASGTGIAILASSSPWATSITGNTLNSLTTGINLGSSTSNVIQSGNRYGAVASNTNSGAGNFICDSPSTAYSQICDASGQVTVNSLVSSSYVNAASGGFSGTVAVPQLANLGGLIEFYAPTSGTSLYLGSTSSGAGAFGTTYVGQQMFPRVDGSYLLGGPSNRWSGIYGINIEATGAFFSGNTPGATCSGPPTASFAVSGGIIIHC